MRSPVDHVIIANDDHFNNRALDYMLRYKKKTGLHQSFHIKTKIKTALVKGCCGFFRNGFQLLLGIGVFAGMGNKHILMLQQVAVCQ